jgi:hypothetical protein
MENDSSRGSRRVGLKPQPEIHDNEQKSGGSDYSTSRRGLRLTRLEPDTCMWSFFTFYSTNM